MHKKLVVGNWKMHGGLQANEAFVDGLLAGLKQLSGIEVALCVPYPYLLQMQGLLKGSPVAWGAQNVSEYEQGAYTGEVSAGMLAELGCRYVLIGHSERRALYGETSAVVAEKYARVVAAGMSPVLCIGETLAEREAGQTLAVIDEQLSAVVERVGVAAFAGAILAYEPVWAIGTGKTASEAQVQEVHAAIRQRFAQASISVSVLYGGSVKVQNSLGLFSMPDVDGGLVGGASLLVEEFLGVCGAAAGALQVS